MLSLILWLFYRQLINNLSIIMYTLTRQQVADKLQISTRSVDRYIKWGKLRAKKEWKVVYINDNDVKNILGWWKKNWEVIMPNKQKVENLPNSEITQNSNSTIWLTEIYKDLRQEIAKKDEIIRELATKVWRSEEIAKNSVSLMDFKKSQFLLEESKSHINNKAIELKENNNKLTSDLKHEKVTNIILIIFLIILLIISWILWFIKI